MSRKEILSTPEYWIAKIQMDLYNCAEDYMEANGMNRTQLANHLGVSKGYVSQLLNGDYDHKLSKLVELAIAFGVVPRIDFKPLDDVIAEDSNIYKLPVWKNKINYIPGFNAKIQEITVNKDYESVPSDTNTIVA